MKKGSFALNVTALKSIREECHAVDAMDQAPSTISSTLTSQSSSRKRLSHTPLRPSKDWWLITWTNKRLSNQVKSMIQSRATAATHLLLLVLDTNAVCVPTSTSAKAARPTRSILILSWRSGDQLKHLLSFNALTNLNRNHQWWDRAMCHQTRTKLLRFNLLKDLPSTKSL